MIDVAIALLPMRVILLRIAMISTESVVKPSRKAMKYNMIFINYFCISTIISFLRKNGTLKGGLYCAEIRGHFAKIPSIEIFLMRSFFLVSTLVSVAYHE